MRESRALSTEEASGSKAPCRTLLDHYGDQDKSSGRAGLLTGRSREESPRKTLPPQYDGEEKASGRAVLGGRSLEKIPSRRLPCQYGGEENAPGKSWLLDHYGGQERTSRRAELPEEHSCEFRAPK
ncbi:hypothetical protein EG329_006365 [Mollisiaceae sp. DMI_Dod_QoI]|nr:hypothetical protein EG329_006365 [Helotiales sp. DMI_Dod_QoI]